MTTTEARIITHMIASLAAAGWVCGMDAAAVIATTEETGVAQFRFTRGPERSWLKLVDGNGKDIVSDWGTNIDSDVGRFLDTIDA